MNRLLAMAFALAMAGSLGAQGFGHVFVKLGQSMLPTPLVQGGQHAQAARPGQPRFDNKVRLYSELRKRRLRQRRPEE